MSYITYLSLTGKKQGLISAGCSTPVSIGNRYQVGHEDQIQILSLNHTITREQNSDHHPIQFIKPIDKSSPLLGVAISENELLEGVFTCYRTSPSGYLELFYEIKVFKCMLVELSATYPHSINDNNNMPYEKALLKYESIVWSHKMAGTSGYSFWEDRVY